MPLFSKLSPHHKKAIILVVAVIVLITVQPFLWSFVLKNAASLQDKKSQQEQISGVNERADDIKKALAEQRETLSQLETVVVPAGKVSTIVEQIERKADDMNVNISIAGITEPAQSSTSSASDNSLALSQVTLSLLVSGPIDSLLLYLDQLEHLPELTVVPSWSLTPATGSNQITPLASPAPIFSAPATSSFTLQLDIIFFLRNQTN